MGLIQEATILLLVVMLGHEENGPKPSSTRKEEERVNRGFKPRGKACTVFYCYTAAAMTSLVRRYISILVAKPIIRRVSPLCKTPHFGNKNSSPSPSRSSTFTYIHPQVRTSLTPMDEPSVPDELSVCDVCWCPSGTFGGYYVHVFVDFA